MSEWEAPTGERQAWPEPQPEPKSKSWVKWAVGGAAVVLLLGAGGLVFALSGQDHTVNGSIDKGALSVTVEYEIDLWDTSCGHVFEEFDGYSDIDLGTEVEVFDGSGGLLGFGTLDDNSTDGNDCNYTAAPFDIKISPDGMYRVTVGNSNRGFLNYTQADVVDGVLYVSAYLG